jgi:hypothetical protein
MSEQTYRVWVEQIRRGWVTVTAPNEETARDRAFDVVATDRWYPESDSVTPTKVEKTDGA